MINKAEPVIDYNDIYMIGQTYALFTSVLTAFQTRWFIQAFCVLVLQVYYMLRLSLISSSAPFHYRWILGLIFQIMVFYLVDRNRRTVFLEAHHCKQSVKDLQRLMKDYLPDKMVVISESLKEILFSNRSFDEFFQTTLLKPPEILQKLNDFKMKIASFIEWKPKALTDDAAAVSSGIIDLLAQKSPPSSPRSSKLTTTAKGLTKGYTFNEFSHINAPNNLYDINCVPIPWGESQAYLLIINDISEKVMGHRNKLEEVFKDKFLASFSHELRTPLNCMLGFTGMLKQSLRGLKDTEAITMIESNSRVLLIFIDGLLDVMLLEKDRRLKLRSRPAKIAEFGHDIELLMKSCLQNKTVNFVLKIHKDLPESLTFDEERVREALLHLLLNAVKFTYVGSITLTIEMDKNDADMMLFSVKDTGIGIKAEEVPYLFQMRLEEGNSMYSKGIGLGLTISQKLARVLGKDVNSPGIRVESEYMKGSTFTLAVCINRSKHKNGDLIKLSEIKCVSSSNILLKDNKIDCSFQSDAVVPSERGHYDKKVRVFKTHESLEFGSMEYPDRMKVFNSPRHIKNKEVKLVKFLSQEELKTEHHFFLSPKSEASQNELSEPEDIGKLYSEEQSPRILIAGSTPSTSKHAPEKLSLFSGETKKEEPSKGRVLVVDDNAFNLRIAVTLLEDLGYSCVTASNGKEAVEVAERESENPEEFFKVIFMDCQMPIMDGYQATQILKDKMMKNEVPLTPIVAITANKNEKDIEKCYESGMDGYLSKPISKEILRSQIRELIADG